MKPSRRLRLALLTAISTATRCPSLQTPQVWCAARSTWVSSILAARRSRIQSRGRRWPGRTVRQQEIERAAENLRRANSRNALAGRIEGLDVAGVVDGDDRVLDVVEDGLQMRGRLLADLARERLRLVRHDLHGAHDAAPLRVEPVVVGAHDPQQRVEVQLAARVRAPRQLALEDAIEAPSGTATARCEARAAMSRDKSCDLPLGWRAASRAPQYFRC